MNTPLKIQSIMVVIRLIGSKVSAASMDASGELWGKVEEEPMWVQAGIPSPAAVRKSGSQYLSLS